MMQMLGSFRQIVVVDLMYKPYWMIIVMDSNTVS